MLSVATLELARLTLRARAPRARNVAFEPARGGRVAFPDDDCRYPATLLADVAKQLAPAPTSSTASRSPRRPPTGTAMRRWGNEPTELTTRTPGTSSRPPGSSSAGGCGAGRGFDESLGARLPGPGARVRRRLSIRALCDGARIDYDPRS